MVSPVTDSTASERERERERERELVKVEEAKFRIMALEVNMQAVEPQKLNVEWRKNASIR